MRILLIEDDSSTSGIVESVLRNEGICVDVADLGIDGLEIGEIYDYNAIVLDLMLPDISVFEVIRRLRSADISTPIIILSGISGAHDRVKCLEIDADDFITKPFEKKELVARIQAVVRRSKGHAESVIKVGRLSINLKTREVKVDEKPIHLTRKEYVILELLCLRRGAPLTKDMFLNYLYGGINEPELKAIDVFICKLRKKLMNAMNGTNYIDTVWGVGYTLTDPEIEACE